MKLCLPAHDVQPGVSGKLIPDGSFVKVTMAIRPGGVDGSSEVDRGLLRASNIPGSDVLSLDCELTVVEGPYAKCTFRQLFTIAGGKTDDNGVSIGWNFSRRMFRGMIDSAFGLDPEDMSEAGKAKRRLRGLADLDGISFVAKVAIAPSDDPRCPEQNRLDRPVLPTEREWRAVMNAENVAPRASTPRAARDGHSVGTSAPTSQPAQPMKPAGPAWLIG